MKKYRIISSLFLPLLCLLPLGGCSPISATGSEAVKTPADTVTEQTPSAKSDVPETACPPEVFDQMLLFLQEGLRERGLMETYQVYFSEPETEEDSVYCEALLQKGDTYWTESFSYTYDSERDW